MLEQSTSFNKGPFSREILTFKTELNETERKRSMDLDVLLDDSGRSQLLTYFILWSVLFEVRSFEDKCSA